jgi:hypothetical protein
VVNEPGDRDACRPYRRKHPGRDGDGGLPTERRCGLLEVDRQRPTEVVSSGFLWNFRPQGVLSPAVSGEESRRVLRDWGMWGSLQSRGVTSGGEGLAFAVPCFLRRDRAIGTRSVAAQFRRATIFASTFRTTRILMNASDSSRCATPMQYSRHSHGMASFIIEVAFSFTAMDRKEATAVSCLLTRLGGSC